MAKFDPLLPRARGCRQYGTGRTGPRDDISSIASNIGVGATDEEAEKLPGSDWDRDPLQVRAGLRDALLEAARRNGAGEARRPIVGGVLPKTSRRARHGAQTISSAAARRARGCSTCRCISRDRRDVDALMRRFELWQEGPAASAEFKHSTHRTQGCAKGAMAKILCVHRVAFAYWAFV